MAKMNTKKTEVFQPEGNYYDKYHSTNPIVKWMMKTSYEKSTIN